MRVYLEPQISNWSLPANKIVLVKCTHWCWPSAERGSQGAAAALGRVAELRRASSSSYISYLAVTSWHASVWLVTWHQTSLGPARDHLPQASVTSTHKYQLFRLLAWYTFSFLRDWVHSHTILLPSYLQLALQYLRTTDVTVAATRGGERGQDPQLVSTMI